MQRILYAIIVVSILLVACEQPHDPVSHDRFYAFGTLIDLSLYGASAEQQVQASTALESAFSKMHNDWHAWQPGALTSINERLASLEQFRARPDILSLLQQANTLSAQSRGLFNPALGKLIELWGFHNDEITTLAAPDPAALEALLAAAPSVNDVTIEGNTIISRNPAVQYDLGAFAKGYAIDRGIELLRSLGIPNAIINAGGDLRAIGHHGDRPWRIGIRRPRQAGVLASVALSDDESIFTSGDYERYFEVDGQRFHHIIDPRDGYPASQSMSVTVIHTDAATADAAATALFVAGPQAWTGIARDMGIHFVMLIDSDGIIHMNPAMQSRIHFEVETPGIILSEPLT